MNYVFNKNIFKVWLALTFILLGVVLINYGDYKEYYVICTDTICSLNRSSFDSMFIIDQTLDEDRLDQPSFASEGRIYGGEEIVYSNYEEKPFLIKNFIRITLIILMLCFIINHICFNRGLKNDNDKG